MKSLLSGILLILMAFQVEAQSTRLVPIEKINAELKELGCVNNALKTTDGKACFINIKKK